MDGLGKILRERARSLGLSDSEVARRLGLSQARYHNYVSDTAEPDLGTLVRICRALGTSPDEVLSFVGGPAARTDTEVQLARLVSAASALEGEALAFTADLVEAMVTVQRVRAGPVKVRTSRAAGADTGPSAKAQLSGKRERIKPD